MQFNLTIQLGNDAMQDSDDVANALAELSDTFYQLGSFIGARNVYDLNGNTVGKWSVTK